MWDWIDATKSSFNTLLLMDTWLIRQIAGIEQPEFREKMAITQKGNPSDRQYGLEYSPLFL